MGETETIRVEVPVPLAVKDTLGGLTIVMSIEEEGENSATEPENPFLLAKSISEVSDPPGAAVRRVLTDDILKSGPVTVTTMYVRCDRLQSLDPSTVTV